MTMKLAKLTISMLGASLLLASCGGGNDGPNPVPAPTATATPTPTPVTTVPCDTGLPSFVTCQTNPGGEEPTYTLAGTVDEDFVMDADLDWRLDGIVTVGAGNVTVADDTDVTAIQDAGVTLTVEAGANILAFDDGALIVTRGSQIIADGTLANPITFSSLDDGFDGEGEWGGIVIQGFAPQYGAGNTGACFGAGTVCNVEGEGGDAVAVYGGNIEDDNSGIIRYVRIAEGGLVAGPNNEINGLTLQGVGHGTTVEYVQIHNNLDDGLEWFGGTVNARYVVLTNNDDDDIDFDEGYQGNIQYALVVKNQTKAAPTGSNDPRGIEANSSDDDYVPQTNAALANVTIIGGPVNNNDTSGQQPGMRLRGSVTVAIHNSAVRGFDTGCIRIDDSDTDGVGGADDFSNVTLNNVFGDCIDGFYDRRDADSENNIVWGAVTLDDAFAITEASAELGAPATIAAVDNGSGFTFDQTDYVGAVEPGTLAMSTWWAGWVLDGSLDGISQVTEPATADFVTCDSTALTCTISGNVDEDYTLLAGWEWRLDGVVTVGAGNVTVTDDTDVVAIQAAGVTLTIQPGTEIKAFDDGVLLITRGSQINANGTAENPITFSSLDDGFDGEGEWGGVIVQGFAPQFGAGNTGACYGAGTVCNVEGEGGDAVAVYGGNIEDDNSGIIRYVRIAEGGLVAGPNNEINGLTLQGVGHGTTVEYVHVHNNLDDGLEWFGGTVNARYVVLTNNDDDDIDFDEGFQGNIQYALVVKNQTKAAPTGSNDPRGIEANSSDDDYVPQTNAALANVTIIGGPVNNNDTSGQQPGMRLRGSVTVAIHNSAVRGFDTGCIRIDDSDTDGVGGADDFSVVTLNNVFGDCQDGFYDRRDADTSSNTPWASVTLDEAMAITEAGAELGAAATIAAVDNGSGFTFDQTDYVGAVEPGTTAANAWWANWTIPGALDDVTPAVAPEAAGFVSCDSGTQVCTITGAVDEDYTIYGGYEWRIDGIVTVGAGNVTVADDTDVAAIQAAGVTLTIQPGQNINAFDDGALIITRGSQIMADGSATHPITFSSLDDGYDGEGEWGGLVVQGFAPQYGAGNTGACFGAGTVCNVEGEGGDAVAVYGGNIADDNSGIIRYVRIAEGGLVAGPNNEINGLTLQGVGHGTTVEYVHVHNNLDDGLEWFGGTVNARYVVLTNNDDDDIDFDEGFQGNIQYAIIVKNQTKTAPTGSNDPRGIEANSSDDDYVPQTNAVLANITIIGGPVNNNAGSGLQPGMRLRGSVNVEVHNTAVNGFDTGCIRIDDSDTDGIGGVDDFSDVTLNNVIGECTGGFYSHRSADTENNAGADTLTLDNAFALTEAAAQLGGVATINAVDNGSGFAFDQTDYIGAVAPGTDSANAWWTGWILDGTLDDAISNNN